MIQTFPARLIKEHFLHVLNLSGQIHKRNKGCRICRCCRANWACVVELTEPMLVLADRVNDWLDRKTLYPWIGETFLGHVIFPRMHYSFLFVLPCTTVCVCLDLVFCWLRLLCVETLDVVVLTTAWRWWCYLFRWLLSCVESMTLGFELYIDHKCD